MINRTFLSMSVAMLMLLLAGPATAQIVPFYAAGNDAIYTPDDGLTSSGGRGRHFGKLFGSGRAVPIADLGNGLFEWVALDYQLTAANGSQMFLDGGGFVQFIPIGGGQFIAEWTGEFNVLGGTGRFSNSGPGRPPFRLLQSMILLNSIRTVILCRTMCGLTRGR